MGMELMHQDNVTSILLDGMLTSTSSMELEEQLNIVARKREPRVVISFRNLSLMTSSGIRVVVSFAQRMKQQKGHLALCEIPANVFKMFEVTGFDKILPVYGSREEALAAVR